MLSHALRAAAGNAGGGGGLPTIQWIGATSTVSTTSTYTFSGVDIGTPSATRLVVIGVSGYNSAGSSRTLNSVTVGGNSATVNIGTAVSAILPGGVASIADSTNSTADIVVTFSGSCSQCAILVWAITDLSSNTPIQALTDGGSFSLSLSVQQAGPYIAFVRGGTSSNITWTGIIENVDGIGSSGLYVSGASAIAATTTNQTITASSFSSGRGFAASWR